MFEINKAQFGSFLSAQRKEKGYTQKELAEKLFISDKAVSKWERGLSLPDISLLIPLADILGITVAELLEGKIIEDTAQANAQQVENLVKKALAFSEKTSEKPKQQKRRRWLAFGLCVITTLFEWLAYFLVTGSFLGLSQGSLFTIQLLSIAFGAYFWILAKERLPAYFDENKISCYNDGIFEMHIPGLYFNNKNWPYILRVGRIRTALDATVFPVCYLGIGWLFPGVWEVAGTFFLLAYYLGGLFIPMYIVGKKYG